jgi:hypothetical protein
MLLLALYAIVANIAQASPPVNSVQAPVIIGSFGDFVEPVRLTDGRLLALSILTRDRDQQMTGRYSTDNGKTWTKPQVLFALVTDGGGFGSFDAFADREGEVHIFFLNDGNSGIFLPKSPDHGPIRSDDIIKDIWHVSSSGRGTQWGTPPKRIWTGRAGDILSVIQLKSGRILLPISYETLRSWSTRDEGAAAFTYMGWLNSSALYSDDDGKTWGRSPDELRCPVPDGSTLGGIEPVVLELKNRRVWMLLRTQMGRFYESYSGDEGTHWTRPSPTTIIASDSPAALVRLQDERILMMWNEANRFPYAYGGRHVLHSAVSADEGRTWRGYREILRDPERNNERPRNGDFGVSYVFPAVAVDGSVLFSAGVQTGSSRYLYRLDPRWISETSQETNFASGIDDWSAFGVHGVELGPVEGNHRFLSIRRADPDWPSGAVWNFPMGQMGHLTLQLMLREGFGGDNLGLTDHYSVPFDDEDIFYNVFNLPVSAEGLMLSQRLKTNQWYRIEFNWDTVRGLCVVSVDDQRIGELRARRSSFGINYLRFHVTADNPDTGLLLRSVEAHIVASSE